MEEINIIIISINNPIDNRQVIVIEKFIKITLNNIKNKIILLGDFNAHYPIWGDRAAAQK